MKFDAQGFSRTLILNLTIVFLNSLPKMVFLVKFATETSKRFVLYETWFVEVAKGADSQFDDVYLNFSLQKYFLGKT